MTQLEELRVGQRVQFFRTHDKQTPLTGSIVGIPPAGQVLIEIDATSVDVPRLEEADPSDVTVLADPLPSGEQNEGGAQ